MKSNLKQKADGFFRKLFKSMVFLLLVFCANSLFAQIEEGKNSFPKNVPYDC